MLFFRNPTQLHITRYSLRSMIHSDETDSLSYKEISCGQPNPRQSDAGGGTGISFVCVSLCHTSDPYEDDELAETDSGSGRNCGGRDQPVCIQCLAFGKGKRGADG